MANHKPEKVSDILQNLLKRPQFKQKSKLKRLRKAWLEVVGDEFSTYTRISSLQGGVLKVEVENSSLLQEFATFQKASLLSQLKESFSEISDIKFTLGAF